MYIFKVSKKKYLLLLIFTAAFFILKKKSRSIDKVLQVSSSVNLSLRSKNKNAFFYFTNIVHFHILQVFNLISVTVLFSTFSV